MPHGDNHDLWIDPDDPDRMIESNDGGANVSFNGGRTWSSIMNQPTAQFYRVITDDRFPYWIYGAQQDNTTVAIASRGRGRGIDPNDWYPVGGGESGWIAPKPKNPEIVFAGSYGGNISRYDHRTGQTRNVVAWPQLAIGQAAKDLKYRFQWNAPIVISPHDPEHALPRAQVLLRSRDEGQTWEEISPDLTRNDKTKQGKSGGPITHDDTGIEVYDTIFTVEESPLEAGRHLGRHRRRPRAADARRREELAERDAEGDPGVDPHQLARRFAARQGDRLRRGDDVPVRRLPALPLQDERLRQDLDEDRPRHPGQRLHARHPRGPGAPRPALRGHGARPLRLLRRRRATGSRCS